ncbi:MULTISPECIES: FAD-linked oxidase C-terminal domain-containing protein [Dactylosporangium]|uniref:FAD-binding protein n=2 Tax=Dactylosporangium TaxID=35753 RepID=A0A9W6NS20_9ACTN|nr:MULTISPECIES: FAD-linked oxidase C-terminal domain-containing protein [Dactylosporangium]UAB98705.1 FAD-binding protein [Dactylosporangium vinaceum]UWZ46959.1 FAD-binding protein [Dactylosporangium matsuzakiense]GLL06851.1 FAD-binding protein [Dactylosporangium matsuzakiense]
MSLTGLRDAVAAILRPDQIITDRARLRTYECDGLAHYRVVPGIVLLPRTAEECAAVVRACAGHAVPFVARGSGTGLSGGALPHAEGALIVTSQLRAIREVAPEDERAVLEPGVINLQVSQASIPHGYFYAPDPSSQQICSIGGNVAENSGGAHCLKYGFTANHVTGVQIVTPDGDLVNLGGRAPDAPGYDLLGAFVGSEGTLGIATEVTVRLVRLPETVRTLLAAFTGTDEAGAATSAIIAAGVVPAAVEMMDALAIEAAEAAVHCGYPAGAGAVLIVELDGPAAEVDAQFAAVVDFCRGHGAFEIRIAADDAERALFWKGRKSAFAAVGRISPDYIVQDGVIPRTALPQVLTRIGELAREHGVRVANVFHAGDGNLHPLVLFDEAQAGQAERAEAVSGAILDLCVEHGGSITGEHGVGMDKAKHLPRMYSEADLDTMQLLRCAFDPRGLANPGKVFPTPRLCGEVPGRHRGPNPWHERGMEVF